MCVCVRVCVCVCVGVGVGVREDDVADSSDYLNISTNLVFARLWLHVRSLQAPPASVGGEWSMLYISTMAAALISFR